MVGADAQRFLQSFCTNDVQRLGVGSGCEAFVTNVKGGVVAHVYVFRDAEQSFWLETAPGAETALIDHLSRYVIREDVQLLDRTPVVGALLLVGAAAEQRFVGVTGENRPLVPVSQCRMAVGGIDVRMRRVDWFPPATYLMLVERSQLVALWEVCVARGAQPAGAEVFQWLRIEAGLPLAGVDVDPRVLAPELSRNATAISFTKGCYLGQEPISRIESRGHVNRELHRIDIQSTHVPDDNAVVQTPDGRDVGHLTSVATAGAGSSRRSIGLAYVRRDAVAHDATVSVCWRQHVVPALLSSFTSAAATTA